MRRAPIALLGLCVLGAPSIVLAQSAQDKADAEVLFNAAKTALAAGNLADACPKFAESQKKDPAIGTALYLAECYERIGKIASAWAQFRQAEDMANQRHDSRASLAKARADRLAPSKMTITLAPGADVAGLEVKRDGEVVGSAFFGLASPIDGGHHVLVASAPGRKPFEWTGDVPTQSGAVTVTIPKLEEIKVATPVSTGTTPVPTVTPTDTATPVTATATSAAPPPDTASGMSGVKVAGIVTGGVGLAAIGASIVMGAVAQGNYQSVLIAHNGTCNDNGGTTIAHCTSQADANTANGAKTLADVGTGVFIGGAVLAAAGVVMFLVAPKSKPRAAAWNVSPWLGAQGGGASLSGRF